MKYELFKEIEDNLDEIASLNEDKQHNIAKIAEIKSNYSYKFNPYKWFVDKDGYAGQEAISEFIEACIIITFSIFICVVVCIVTFSISLMIGLFITFMFSLMWGIFYFGAARPKITNSHINDIEACKKNIYIINNKLKRLNGFNTN